jgi:RimJ/RimL family protein N-acetyltransferase
MNDENIVFEGKSKSGRNLTIRYPKLTDAPAMLTYINKISIEYTYINLQGEQKTLEEEQEMLKKFIKGINEHKAVMLLAVVEGNVIGISEVMAGKGASSHEGTFGISVAEEYRGEGIGKLLTRLVLEEAEKNIPQLRIVTLGVFADNEIGIDMYRKFGFIEYGRLPQGFLRKGQYTDHVYMYKKVR